MWCFEYLLKVFSRSVLQSISTTYDRKKQQRQQNKQDYTCLVVEELEWQRTGDEANGNVQLLESFVEKKRSGDSGCIQLRLPFQPKLFISQFRLRRRISSP